ncbi:MAG: hypothetical protein R2702_04630 [Acidimicrobiales bacterium]
MRQRPPGGRTRISASSASWPSRSTSTLTATVSPTVRFGRPTPPCTWGRGRATTMRAGRFFGKVWRGGTGCGS